MSFLKPPYRWYHGLIFLVIINLLTFAWLFTDVNYYNSLNKPFFSPPSWVFGPAWITNNILVIYGNIVALNLRYKLKSPEMATTLANLKISFLQNYFYLQALSWFNFVIFSVLSFGTKIPALFFWPTFSMWLLTVFSIYFAVQIDSNSNPKGFWHTVKNGKSITFSFTTLIIWLTIATYLGGYIWLNN